MSRHRFLRRAQALAHVVGLCLCLPVAAGAEGIASFSASNPATWSQMQAIPVEWPVRTALREIPQGHRGTGLSRSLQQDSRRLLARPPSSLRGESDLGCLAVAIYHEARNQSLHGQLAVASVIQQRAMVRGRWGDTVCQVVKPVQFSFMTSDYDFPGIYEDKAWKASVRVALRALRDGPLPELRGADHYHTVSVKPSWRHSMQMVGQIGAHLFYRDPRSGS